MSTSFRRAGRDGSTQRRRKKKSKEEELNTEITENTETEEKR